MTSPKKSLLELVIQVTLLSAEKDLQVARQEVEHLQPISASVTRALDRAQHLAHKEENITFKDIGIATFNTSDYAKVIPVEGWIKRISCRMYLWMTPPVEYASPGPIRDDWLIMLGRLKHITMLTHKRFNGDLILIKQKYEGYKKEQIKDALEEIVDYFNQADNNGS